MKINIGNILVTALLVSATKLFITTELSIKDTDCRTLLDEALVRFKNKTTLNSKVRKVAKEEYKRLSKRLEEKSAFSRSWNMKELRRDIEDFHNQSLLFEFEEGAA